MQQSKSWRTLTATSWLVILMPSLVVAAPCHKTMPVTMGSTAPCGGLLVPEATVREAVRCGAVTLPRCQSDLRLMKASQVDATLLTPAPERPLINARAWWVGASFLTVGVIVGWAMSSHVSLP